MSFDVTAISDKDNMTQQNIVQRENNSFKFSTYKDSTVGASWITIGKIL